ncbi:ferrous iron transporter B [Candidatus Peregrinibacteria bacterium]|nr:ferrous iron transporter B [Candidatus Peregrinibacteria bacterium]
MKILLIGNPNVGKSAFFSRLTGVNVVISNYPGTTVEFRQGKMKFGKKLAEIIDVPGHYMMEPTCKAEKVATQMLKEGDLVINVVDATNLERNLYLTLQLLEKKIPVIVALNFWDEAKHQGVGIDIETLEKILKIPVVPTCAVTGEGIKRLVSRLPEAKAHSFCRNEQERWCEIGRIIEAVQRLESKRHTLFEKLEDLSVKPLTGLPIAACVLSLTFYLVRLIGENLIGYLFEPLFGLYSPLAMRLSDFLGSGFIHDVLIGSLVGGEIDYVQSMGLLTTGLFVPIGMVLPYVFAFYLALGFLEDSGYLPRLATLVDNVMHKFGMHGLAIIPMLLGLGCNVPGALATRILETRRQRFIAATLMAISIPCMAQIAMVFGLLGQYGAKGLGILFATLAAVWFILGFLLNKIMKGVTPETFMEIPPYRVPHVRILAKKLWMRIRKFLTEAIPFVFLGVFFVNILYATGVIEYVSNVTAPVIVGVLGLPKEAVASLVIGFLRKDVAVGMLLPLGLSMKQLVIASTVLTMYFPCIATFVVLFRELGAKDLAKSTLIMVLASFSVGGILNLIL